MPRKGNPQHNARKRVARERAKAVHEAGFLQQKRRRAMWLDDGAALAAAAAILFSSNRQ